MKKIILLVITHILMSISIFSQSTQKVDFGGTARRGAVCFNIGTKLYIGTGFDGILYKDFWEFDTENNKWTKKADFAGTARWDAVGFSIGNKGYIGTGWTGSIFKRDFWEFDPNNNTWTRKADFGGPIRRSAVGFSIDSKGYIGTGYGTPSGTYYQDFWEYDPIDDVWNQKMDFPGTKRDGAVGFNIGSKGYIGTGSDLNGNYYKDFWEFDPLNNTWTKKANFGGTARLGAIGFSIGAKGYIGTGINGFFPYTVHKDFWEFNPVSDSWTIKENFGGLERSEAIGCSIGTKAYIGIGQTDLGYTIDFWEYSTNSNVNVSQENDDYRLQLYPNPSNDKIFIEFIDYQNAQIEIFNIDCQLQKAIYLYSLKTQIDIRDLRCGIYFVKINNAKGVTVKKMIKQ